MNTMPNLARALALQIREMKDKVAPLAVEDAGAAAQHALDFAAWLLENHGAAHGAKTLAAVLCDAGQNERRAAIKAAGISLDELTAMAQGDLLPGPETAGILHDVLTPGRTDGSGLDTAWTLREDGLDAVTMGMKAINPVVYLPGSLTQKARDVLIKMFSLDIFFSERYFNNDLI